MKPNGGIRPRARAVLAVGAAGSLALLAAAGPASRASAGPVTPAAGKTAVPQGIGAGALKHASVFGSTDPNTPERVSFILKARNLAALKSEVLSASPHGFQGVPGFKARFGQTDSNISALRSYLSGFGIHTSVYRDGLDVRATGKAGSFNKALSVQQEQFRLPATKAHGNQAGRPARTIHGTRSQPLLPRNLASFTLAVLGLTDYPVGSSHFVKKPHIAAGKKPAKIQTGELLPSDFAKRYNLTGLYKQGFSGKGETIGIVTLASMDPADAYHFWKNVLHLKVASDKLRLVNVDGGSGPVSADAGSDETSLDAEESGALAPGAKVVVYQAAPTDPGFLDAFYLAASQNVADTVSTSWGEAEDVVRESVQSGQEDPAIERVFNQVFLEYGAQGQSSFVAQGDQGAYDDSNELGSTDLDIDNPGDSPYTTSAGGTTLPGDIPLTSTDTAHIKAERAWGWDWLWPHYLSFGAQSEAQFAFAEAVGTGGGYSKDLPRPSYQKTVPGLGSFRDVLYLTPVRPAPFGTLTLPSAWQFSQPQGVGTGKNSFGRGVPDVSTDADPFTGYLFWFEGGPLAGGGTSFVAPQLNGSTAVIDQMVGHRVGFWNPRIYRWATQSRSPFRPLSAASASNDNLYYTGSPGRVWNPASGLGTPNLTALARDFAR